MHYKYSTEYNMTNIFRIEYHHTCGEQMFDQSNAQVRDLDNYLPEGIIDTIDNLNSN